MFDTFVDLFRDILEPIGTLGRVIILAIGAGLLIFTVAKTLLSLSKADMKGMLMFGAISIGLGIIAYGGYQAFQTLGEQGGQDFEGQINALQFFLVAPAYMLYRSFKKQQKPN